MADLTAAEICVGAGGMALGVSAAGFKHIALVELDKNACKTIRENGKDRAALTQGWPLHEGDIRKFDYASVVGTVDLLCAGVPCQPFSLGGKGKAHRDQRDLFIEVFRAARELQPKAIFIENVKGILRGKLADYFAYIQLALGAPSVSRKKRQSWRQHYKVLKEQSPTATVRYKVHVHSVNAADYGVPQNRERVVVVAFRSDLNLEWTLPPVTHCRDALLWDQWQTGLYWKRHGVNRKRPGTMSARMSARLTAMRQSKADTRPTLLPWKTVRDAICSLPKPTRDSAPKFSNHELISGARAYPGHSGSLLDEPAKTLKAGSHGVPGGENALALGAGRVRYFTLRECARLQTFPDAYVFTGAWTTAMRQLGNAVPVELARVIAVAIRARLQEALQESVSAGAC